MVGRDRYYVDVHHHRAGRELYTQLLRRLAERGYLDLLGPANQDRPLGPIR
jgi:hypothetical protein